MSALGAILMIVTGLAIMAFGLFLFYAWLPVLYALLGLDLGLLIGKALTGEVGTLAFIIGCTFAILLAVASYSIEPFRRVLLGISVGVLAGLSLAAAFKLDGFFGGLLGTVLAILFGLLGAALVPRVFDSIIVVASAITGAAMVVAGATLLLPGVPALDVNRPGFAATILIAVLSVVGIVWQFTNIGKWIQRRTDDEDPLATSPGEYHSRTDTR